MRNNNTKLKIFLVGIAGVTFVLLIYLIFVSIVVPRSGFIGTIANFQFQITGSQCFDGNDNDGDGLIDYPTDPGCDSTSDDDETDIAAGGGGGGGIREEEEIITPPGEEVAQIDKDIPGRKADIPAVTIDEEDEGIDESKPPLVEKAVPAFIPDFVVPVPIFIALITILLGAIWYALKRRKRQRQLREIGKEAK